MENFLAVRWFGRLRRLVPGGAIACLAPALTQRVVTPVPQVTGPISVTLWSYPFGYAWNIDLAKAPYAEQEFFVSGRGNVYQYAPDGTVSVRTPNVPYTTRLLVRRPVDPKRFSGRVIVEIINMSRGWDLDVLWQAQHRYFLRNGNVYVGVASKPNAVKALKTFDPERYAPLSWPNPLPLSDPANCTTIGMRPGDSSRETENGLVWDTLSHVGAVVESSPPQALLAGLAVRRSCLIGYSQSWMFLKTYIGAIYPLASLENGRPIYDGYMVGAAPCPISLSQCGPQIEASDSEVPRRAWISAPAGNEAVLVVTPGASHPRRSSAGT